jgi:hypothetical protein
MSLDCVHRGLALKEDKFPHPRKGKECSFFSGIFGLFLQEFDLTFISFKMELRWRLNLEGKVRTNLRFYRNFTQIS